MLDYKRFQTALQTVLSSENKKNGIGTLGEKTVHAVLKHCYEPDQTHHEVKCGDFVADILSENNVFEIQSRGFERLLPKLNFFLEHYDVTIIYPIVVQKEIIWIVSETGECRKPRISNKHGNALDLFPELYKIRSFLTHPHLHIRAVMIEAREYRMLDGQGEQKKKHATKEKLIPTEFLQEISVNHPQDYLSLLPQTLSQTFTAETLCRESGATLRSARMTLRVLREFNLIEKIGKEKRQYLYSVLIQNS